MILTFKGILTPYAPNLLLTERENNACRSRNMCHPVHRNEGGGLGGADPGFPVGGVSTLQWAPTYDFAKISEKLHEIEKI